MPNFEPDHLEKLAFAIYVAKGTPEEEASVVATHQIKANLVGHDSHGVIHIPEYCERIDTNFSLVIVFESSFENCFNIGEIICDRKSNSPAP